MMRPKRETYHCGVRPCRAVKGINNHWFLARIDAFGRLIVDHFDAVKAEEHGTLAICSEACLSRHVGRWAARKITAEDRPACASPAIFEGDQLTCWVSTTYRQRTKVGEARIITYMDNGQPCQIWCFRDAVFDRVDLTQGTHARFRLVQKGEFMNVADVISIDGHSPEEYLRQLDQQEQTTSAG